MKIEDNVLTDSLTGRSLSDELTLLPNGNYRGRMMGCDFNPQRIVCFSQNNGGFSYGSFPYEIECTPEGVIISDRQLEHQKGFLCTEEVHHHAPGQNRCMFEYKNGVIVQWEDATFAS